MGAVCYRVGVPELDFHGKRSGNVCLAPIGEFVSLERGLKSLVAAICAACKPLLESSPRRVEKGNPI